MSNVYLLIVKYIMRLVIDYILLFLTDSNRNGCVSAYIFWPKLNGLGINGYLICWRWLSIVGTRVQDGHVSLHTNKTNYCAEDLCLACASSESFRNIWETGSMSILRKDQEKLLYSWAFWFEDRSVKNVDQTKRTEWLQQWEKLRLFFSKRWS